MKTNFISILHIFLTSLVFSRSLKEIDQELSSCNGVELQELTIKQVHAYYRNGRLTASDLTQCYLKRIKEMDNQLNSVIETNPDAMKIAQDLDLDKESCLKLPLCGIPILLKDNIGTKDKMETTAGTLALVGVKPKKDAKVVTALRKAGAIILGKTNLSELAGILLNEIPSGASGRGGQTTNPYHKDYQVWGSSTGSAVAVAANLAMGALGTETSGSLVTPASVNSVVALKPSHKLISNDGVIPFIKSMDTVGAITRTTTDNWVITQVIMGKKVTKETTEKKKFRVGVIRIPYFKKDSQQWIQLDEMLIRLNKTGVEVVDNLSANIDEALHVFDFEYMKAELKLNINEYLQNETEQGANNEGSKVIDSLADIVNYNQRQLNGTSYLTLIEAEKLNPDPVLQTQISEKTKKLTRQVVDKLLSSDKLGALIIPNDIFAVAIPLSSLSRYPIITIPSGFSIDGTPNGLSLFGPEGSESTLIELAHRYENTGQRIRVTPKFNGY